MRTTLRPTLTRRTATVGLVAVGAAAGLAACSAPGSGGGESDDAPDEEIPETPSEAVALNIFDVAGAQKELGPMIEKWAEDHPEYRLLGELRIRRRPVPRGPRSSRRWTAAVSRSTWS